MEFLKGVYGGRCKWITISAVIALFVSVVVIAVGDPWMVQYEPVAILCSIAAAFAGIAGGLLILLPGLELLDRVFSE